MSPASDRDFDPSAEMLIHDYDDERTIDEEEACSNEDAADELDDLKKVFNVVFVCLYTFLFRKAKCP